MASATARGACWPLGAATLRADAMRVFLATVLRHLVIMGVTQFVGHSIQLSHILFHSIQVPSAITDSIEVQNVHTASIQVSHQHSVLPLSSQCSLCSPFKYLFNTMHSM